MLNSLEISVVSVLHADGHVVGTGFVVSPRLILTCAHVAQLAGGGPGSKVTVCFHLGYERRQALVLTEYWRPPDGGEDVAVLQVDGELPAGVVPVALGESAGLEGHSFRAFGYAPFGKLTGLWATGKIQGSVVESTGRQLIQLESPDLAPGMSGAPVLDEATGMVVGMVTAGSSPAQLTHKHRDLALATPSETLLRVCPQLPAPRRSVANPCFTGGRIYDSRLFFGRERLVREIRAELAKRSSVSLVGESQMGKSSLLYYLYATRADWLPDVTVEYIDLQRVLDESDFCETVLNRLGAEGDTLKQLKKALESRIVVLLLDEVERIAEQDFNPRLHDLLRSLTQEQGRLTLCLATQHPLEEVFPARTPGGVSPFHNIFTRKFVGPFTEAEARAFLTARLANTGVTLTAHEIEHLLLESQCHPAKLQTLAKALFEERQRMSDG